MGEKKEALAILRLKPASRKKLMDRFGAWASMNPPESWFDWGLEEFAKYPNLTVYDLIMLRATYSLAVNAKYQNSDLLKEILSRTEGKVKLTVEHKRNDVSEDEKEFEGMNDDQLRAAVDDLVDRLNAPALEIEGEVTE